VNIKMKQQVVVHYVIQYKINIKFNGVLKIVIIKMIKLWNL